MRASDDALEGLTVIRFEEETREVVFTEALAFALAEVDDWRPPTVALAVAVAVTTGLVSVCDGMEDTKLSYQLFTKL